MSRVIVVIAPGASLTLLLLAVTCLPMAARGNAPSTAPGAIIQVAEGAQHACALTGAGGVLCWGSHYAL